jgi:hypothetical protein
MLSDQGCETNKQTAHATVSGEDKYSEEMLSGQKKELLRWIVFSWPNLSISTESFILGSYIISLKNFPGILILSRISMLRIL